MKSISDWFWIFVQGTRNKVHHAIAMMHIDYKHNTRIVFMQSIAPNIGYIRIQSVVHV